MLKSNKPVYLTDAVNAIITKPCNDEIARLRKSISAELELQKSGQELTPEQQQRVVEVNAKIEEQKSKLRKLPRCNNIILTAMLHEVIDRMPQEERDELTRLEQERSRNRKEIENVIAELRDIRISLGSNSKYLGEGEKESLEKRLPELEEKCMIMDADYDENKGQLPLAFWIGYNKDGKRAADMQTPTQYFYIDIDHPKMPARLNVVSIQFWRR